MPGRIRILLVDDSAGFLRAAGRWLAGEPGFEVVGTAASGEEAIEAVARLAPDLVVMDLAMPGIGGLAATRAIKEHPGAPLIVVVSLHDSGPARAESLAAGADAFLGKGALTSDFSRLALSLAGRGKDREKKPGAGPLPRHQPDRGRKPAIPESPAPDS